MSDMPHDVATVSDEDVEIVLPLRVEHAATLRVIVSSLGSDHGLNVDEIDDLKLAVSEIFTLLVEGADDVGASRAHVRFTAGPADIHVHFDRGVEDDTIELDGLARTILSSVVDEHVVSGAGVSIVKRIDNAA